MGLGRGVERDRGEQVTERPCDRCGTGVEIADLIPEPAEITPAAAGPRVYRFKLAPVEPKNWGE